jgi:hypothetical protein
VFHATNAIVRVFITIGKGQCIITCRHDLLHLDSLLAYIEARNNSSEQSVRVRTKGRSPVSPLAVGASDRYDPAMTTSVGWWCLAMRRAPAAVFGDSAIPGAIAPLAQFRLNDGLPASPSITADLSRCSNRRSRILIS